MVEKNSKIKNLTVTELKKKNRELSGVTEHEIEVGGDIYKIKIDKIFRQTKQNSILDDLVSFFNEGNNRLELLDLATPYTSLLMIKYFTSIEVPDDIDGALEVLNALIDLGIVLKIIDLMPEKEVTKMYELLSATANRIGENIEDAEEELKEAYSQFDNEEVTKLLKSDE